MDRYGAEILLFDYYNSLNIQITIRKCLFVEHEVFSLRFFWDDSVTKKLSVLGRSSIARILATFQAKPVPIERIGEPF